MDLCSVLIEKFGLKFYGDVLPNDAPRAHKAHDCDVSSASQFISVPPISRAPEIIVSCHLPQPDSSLSLNWELERDPGVPK